MSYPSFPTTTDLVLGVGYIIRRPGLTGYWSFDNAATPGADTSGLGDTAVLTGTADTVGISGRGRSFTAATDAMDI